MALTPDPTLAASRDSAHQCQDARTCASLEIESQSESKYLCHVIFITLANDLTNDHAIVDEDIHVLRRQLSIVTRERNLPFVDWKISQPIKNTPNRLVLDLNLFDLFAAALRQCFLDRLRGKNAISPRDVPDGAICGPDGP